MIQAYDEDGCIVPCTPREYRMSRATGESIGRSRVPQTYESCVTPTCLNRVFESVVGTYLTPQVCPMCGEVMTREER